ncbi:thiolase family protein [Aquibium sp. LZ166]|uniref:Thiolase family protein n=1 Tax=Aquibium pacificus TaxID=3153579 RepID=A0ABV3SLC2_9HYPH
MSRAPLIIDAVRSPMGRGKSNGALASIHPVELLAQLLSSLTQRTGIDPGLVDDVIIGCVSQVSEQSATPGRMALLAAGFPEHVPATTIDRKCGSSQQAIHFAAQGIAAGAYDLVIAGGVESMSRVPMGSARQQADPFGPSVRKRYSPGLVSQGVAAELVAGKWHISREEMDAYAMASHQRAATARDSGAFATEIVPIVADHGPVERDETIRGATTMDGLGVLEPAFRTDDNAARFPEINWGVTPGNSSQITDGAAVVLLASEAYAAKAGLTPRARFVSFDVRGDDPLLMLTAPIEATRRVLAKGGLSLSDIDHFEINEAFASVPLAWCMSLGADPSKLNPRGGAIALGHPLGASGARLMTTMVNALEQGGGRYGLQSMCEAGGMANATIIELI